MRSADTGGTVLSSGMANILEFLRGLLTNDTEQQQFGRDPYDYLTTRGVTDLSGEVVVEGIRALVRTLPPDTGSHLSPYVDGNNGVPSPRPRVGESEVDAAVRQLQFAISLVHRVERPTETPEPQAEPGASDWPLEQFAVEPQPKLEQEPVAVQTESVFAMPATPTAAPAPDPYAVFGDEVAAILRHASEQMQATLDRAEEQAASILQQAARDANGIRDQANEEARMARETANREADSLMHEAKSTREEAEGMLQRAQEAERAAAERLQQAEQESNTMLEEARTRRDSMRDAERELKKRLEGVQNLFQTLDDSGGQTPEF
jgi:hypothetical protein